MIGIGEILGYNILLYICMLNIDLELLFLNISIIKICLWECLYFDRIKVYVFENKFFVFGCGMLVILFWFVNVEFFVEVYNFLI